MQDKTLGLGYLKWIHISLPSLDSLFINLSRDNANLYISNMVRFKVAFNNGSTYLAYNGYLHESVLDRMWKLVAAHSQSIVYNYIIETNVV